MLLSPETSDEVGRLDNSTIIDLFWKRSETAVAETELKYGNYCKSIAYNILGSHEDAEECANDAYIKAWSSIPPQKPVSLCAYLAKITRNLSLNKYKQRKALKRVPSEIELIFHELEDCIPAAGTPESESETDSIAEALGSFLKALADGNQIVFVRRYWYGDSIRSICERFGISESKVKSILYRCRGKLKKHLEKEGIAL